MRPLPRRKVLAWAGVSGVSVLVPSCLSPTIPLPPPEAPDALQVGQGTYTLQGYLPLFGDVYARNERTREIRGRASVLQYRFDVLAEPGDEMILWYQTGGDISSPVRFLIDRLNPIVGDGGP